MNSRVGTIALVALALLAAHPVASVTAGPQTTASPDPDPVRAAIWSMYNLDFDGAHRVLDGYVCDSPSDPLGHAARAAALIFAEFDRLRILELDFFDSDDRLTDRERLRPDPEVGRRILAATAEARRLASAKLKTNPDDRHALFALTMAVGIETQYATIVEKRYIHGGSLSKEAQGLADRMLTLEPPIYDAYVTLGAIEYTVANLNPFYRFFARLRGLRSSKEKAVEHLKLVVDNGRYYGPYARILLAVFHMREKELVEARALLNALRKEFPANPLFGLEIARIDEKLAAGAR